jgi:hypothetical protein
LLRSAFKSPRASERRVVCWAVLTLSFEFGIEWNVFEHATFHCSFNRRSSRYFVFRIVEVVDILFLGLNKPLIFYVGDRRNRRYFVFRIEEAVDILFFGQKKLPAFHYSGISSLVSQVRWFPTFLRKFMSKFPSKAASPPRRTVSSIAKLWEHQNSTGN